MPELDPNHPSSDDASAHSHSSGTRKGRITSSVWLRAISQLHRMPRRGQPQHGPITEVFRLATGDVKFTCARCGKRMVCPTDYAGKRLRCWNCRLPFVVPGHEPSRRNEPRPSRRLLRRRDIETQETATEIIYTVGSDGMPIPVASVTDDQIDPLEPLGELEEMRADLPPPPPDRYAPKVHFQDFEVVDRIGGGGMGAVFRVRRGGKDYALKLLDPSLSDESSYLHRFNQEAQLLQRVEHPNLVRIYEHGVHEGRPYILMEYCNGPNLRQLVKRYGPMSWPLSTAIIAQVAAGLDAALKAGVIHRDVKPDNILLLRDEHGSIQAKLVDFGLIKQIGRPKLDTSQFTLDKQDWLRVVDGFTRHIKRMLKGRDAHLSWRQRLDEILATVRREFAQQKPIEINQALRDNFKYLRQVQDDNRSLGLTRTGECFGTPKFMAPEMWLDIPCDHRADVFALGVTWYWLVSEGYPFEGKNVQETMEQILRDPPISLSRRLGVVALGGESMIYTMINKLPDQRYPTYERLIADCDRLLRAEEPVIDFFGETLGLYTSQPEPGEEAQYVTEIMRRFIDLVSVRQTAPPAPINDIG